MDSHPPPQCMPDNFKDKDTITAYKKFYIEDKVKIKGLSWKKQEDNLLGYL